MKINVNRKNVVPLFGLFLVICLAFVMRFKGVWFGYPLPVHPDEPRLVNAALGIIETGDLNPHFFNYPSLNIYLQALLYKIIQSLGYIFYDISPSKIPVIWYYIVGRTLNVFISVLTIIITYKIGSRLFSPLAGFFSVVFLAVSFLHVTNSFVLTVDSPVAFWASLVTLMAVLIYTERKKTKYYLLGGIFVGLAIGSKYTAFVCVTPLLIAHYTQSRSGKDWIDKNIIMGLIAIPIAFLITTPYAVLDYKDFMAAVLYEAIHYSRGHFGSESDASTSFYLYGDYLITKGYGTIPIIFSGLGLIWLLRKAPWKAAIIVITPIVLYIFVGRYKVFFPRNVVTTIPFLSLLSGFFLFALYETLTKKLSFLSKPTRALVVTVALVIVLSVSVWQQTVVVLDHIEFITLPDTRWVSLKWIKKNLPSGSVVGREAYTPPIEKYTGKFNVRYLSSSVFDKELGVVEDLDYMKPGVVKDLDYMIVSSSHYGRFLKYPHSQEAKIYKEFFKTHKLVKDFIPDRKTLGGPRIRVFKIKHCLYYQFGSIGRGWLPLTGDWDGNGTDTIGFYDPSTGKFFIKNSHAVGNADRVYQFGLIGRGWLPLTGDWDGDGTDTVGLYDPMASQFYLRNFHHSGVADLTYSLDIIGNKLLVNLTTCTS